MTDIVNTQNYDLIVVGSGGAGLAAAVSYLQEMESNPAKTRVALIERGSSTSVPGNSRWTGGYLRMADEKSMAPDFLSDMKSFAEGDMTTSPPRHVSIDNEYFSRLAKDAPSTLAWLKKLNVEFERLPTVFLAMSGPRLLPVGGGNAVIESLTREFNRLEGEMMWETTGQKLVIGDSGAVEGIIVRGTDGLLRTLTAPAVVLATGGFQGNPEMMASYIGNGAGRLNTIAPGGAFNKGEGIRMALEIGAEASGQWDMIHAEPTDPRSERPEAVMMLYPYGLLLNTDGERFIDEGEDTVQDTFESVAYQVYKQKGQSAWFIADQSLYGIDDYHRAILTEKGPYVANTLSQLVSDIGLPIEAAVKTIEDYNASCQPGEFDAASLDGLETQGLELPKSNWARPIAEGPFLAWPISCSVVFTFGGIKTNAEAEVVNPDNRPIPGLYAAGEMCGTYYHKYPGGTSFLRGLTFGRIAGKNIAAALK